MAGGRYLGNGLNVPIQELLADSRSTPSQLHGRSPCVLPIAPLSGIVEPPAPAVRAVASQHWEEGAAATPATGAAAATRDGFNGSADTSVVGTRMCFLRESSSRTGPLRFLLGIIHLHLNSFDCKSSHDSNMSPATCGFDASRSGLRSQLAPYPVDERSCPAGPPIWSLALTRNLP
ncbi:hypothetical protein RB213_008136 [Colletotrichum asianum]